MVCKANASRKRKRSTNCNFWKYRAEHGSFPQQYCSIQWCSSLANISRHSLQKAPSTPTCPLRNTSSPPSSIGTSSSTVFEKLNRKIILLVTVQFQGGTGPFGGDSQGWRHLCKSFRSASSELYNLTHMHNCSWPCEPCTAPMQSAS